MKQIEAELRGGAPGSGKTHELLYKDWKKFKGRCLYFSHSHDACAEKFYELSNKGIKVRHIFGLGRICPCLRKKEEERSPEEHIIANLHYRKFPNKVICSMCKNINAFVPQKSCPYKQQFKEIKKFHIVLTVIHCAYGNQLFDKYQPEYIAMDDCLDYINPQLLQSLWLLSFPSSSILNPSSF